MTRQLGVGVIAALVAAGAVEAQDLQLSWTYSEGQPRGDHMETVLAGGVHIRNGGLEIRAERAFLLLDRDEVPDLRQARREGLPRRGLAPPNPRRQVSETLLRERMQAFLRAAKGSSAPQVGPSSVPVDLVHAMYLEGDVVVIQDGVELGRADRLYFSAVDDRTVMYGAELRLWSTGGGGPDVVIIRGDKLVRQGRRITGRDVSMTTCIAGEPHFEVELGEIEVLQRDEDFEVRTSDGTLAVSGISLLPLPNTSFLAREQSNFPIKGVATGYSSVDGAQVRVDLGGSLNPIGGALHRFFTGREAHEFHGDWRLGLGYNQHRGWPVDAGLRYEADGLYRGRFEGFYLDDDGPVRREITTLIDGTPITEDQRTLLFTENRVWLGEKTTLDLTAFHAGDPAVRTEFYPREYREDELPETSAHLRHAADNVLFTTTVRANLTDFAYDDGRALTPTFREELPLATFHVFSEPIATLPFDVPLLLTSAGSAGYLRSDFDRQVPGISPLPVPSLDDDVVRIDEELELATPFWWGPLGFRPYASARVTYFDHDMAGRDRTRGAFAAGIRAGTRLARSWTWADADGNLRGIRHIMSPFVSFQHRYKVDGDPSQFHQFNEVAGGPGVFHRFDDVDSLDEGAVLRVELLNRFQTRREDSAPHQFLWLDLAQNITPISDRDNMGHHLGIFEYELLVAPEEEWVPIPNLRFLFEGEHDWNDDRERTFNVGTRFGKVLGFDWHAQYRRDRVTDGSVDYGATTELLNRWGLGARTQYDLQRDETTNYSANLVRQDHDWLISFGVNFNTVDNNTSFYVNFQPTGGGLFRARNRQFETGSILDGANLGY